MMHVEANSRGLRRGFETVRNRNTSGIEACVVVIIEICALLGFLQSVTDDLRQDIILIFKKKAVQVVTIVVVVVVVFTIIVTIVIII
jgi:hypothetical protein